MTASKRSSMRSVLNKLRGIREQLEQSDDWEQGEVDASDNESNVSDSIDLYLAEIADLAAIEYQMDDDATDALIYDTADLMGIPIPDEGAIETDVAEWFGKATTQMFAQAVLKRAADMSKK